MTLFAPLHLTILASILLMAGLLVWSCRLNARRLRVMKQMLGYSLAVNEIIWWTFRYAHEGVHLRNLPLQLCDVAVWLAVAACFLDSTIVREAAYFPGLAGATMALLTPDLFSPWPTYPAIYFFLSHGGIVVAMAVIVFGGRVTFPAKAVWRQFGLILAYAALVGTFDRFSGANHMYLMRKPAGASPLDAMGPWPWYLAGGAALALILFWLLWLPVRRHSESGEPVSVRDSRAASADGSER